MSAANVVALVMGVAIVATAAADALNTLVSTRLKSARWWPSDVFYQSTWGLARRLGRRISNDEKREAFYSLFGPLSLLGLLILWVGTQLIGWSLVWWGLQNQMVGINSYLDALYYAGIGYFTIGFGDVLPVGGPARLLTLLEAFIGVGTTALVIGYLPVLYAAYSAREAQLLSLDDFTGDRITPVTLVEAHAPDGDLDTLYAWFGEWERWCAGILESHTSFPMLTLFRSQHPGQSWITALGVVTDSASLVLASLDTTRHREPLMLYRRSTRTLTLLGERLGLEPVPAALREDFFRIAYDRLAKVGPAVRPFEEAWADLQPLRSSYSGWLEALIDHLEAPRGFWGHAIQMPTVASTMPPAARVWGEAGPPVADGVAPKPLDEGDT